MIERKISMKTFVKILRVVLIVLNIFLALTALAGCIQLLEGTYAPSVDYLASSLFKDYTIPGLSLGLIVGGSALAAFIFLLRKSKFGTLAAAAAGISIMFFEFVEVLIIGSPDGVARTLQIFYFGLGTLIVVVSFGAWFLDLLAEQ
jgi:hypothetical protein